MRKTAWPILILAALAAACLVSKTEHTLYLDPDGAVEWVVLEQDIRSAEENPEKRAAEERDFLAGLRVRQHPVALALESLRPLSLESQLLRETRPYAVRTRASFASIDVLLAGFLEELDADPDVWLEREADLTRLTVRFSLRNEAPVTRETGVDETLLALLEDSWRIVLTRGAFVEMAGFEPVSGDEAELGDVVELRWDTLEDLADPEGQVTLSLAWQAH
jgi:hypothetical protein